MVGITCTATCLIQTAESLPENPPPMDILQATAQVTQLADHVFDTTTNEVVLPADLSRNEVTFFFHGAGRIYFHVSGGAAVSGAGPYLEAGGALVVSGGTQISAIADTVGSRLSIIIS